MGSSFRDPAGFVFREGSVVKRAITPHGQRDYDLLLSSGLYEKLIQNRWLVSHEEAAHSDAGFYKLIVPEQIPLVTYPYEWCFSQLKDAAILTLQIQLLAIEHGMSLKDASPFNIQWKDGSPILMDTLSFEEFKERPWFAYRQFCEMFLAPLVLMIHGKPDFNKYLSVDLSGIRLSDCSRRLPFSTRFHLGYLVHIHLHALSQEKFNRTPGGGTAHRRRPASFKFSKTQMTSVVRSLLSFVNSLHLRKQRTAFGNYYAECSHYSKEAEEFKRRQIEAWATETGGVNQMLDLGGNNGKFSRIFSKKGVLSVSVDSDPYCVEENYLGSKRECDKHMLPLVIDLTNPPQDLGWSGNEREAFFKRVRPDLVMALALIHHLRITHNVSMAFIADFFFKIAPALIIEFVPKSDSMSQKLLANRDDIFHDYDEDHFEAAFGRTFEVVRKTRIPQTQRTLYFLRRH